MPAAAAGGMLVSVPTSADSGRPRYVARRLAVSLLGVALALLAILALLEVGLRVAGAIALARRGEPPATPGSRAILCVGDSWTYGAETADPSRESWPARLGQLVDAELGPGRFRVVNRGRPGLAASHLALELPGLLREVKPMAMVAMVGSILWVDPEPGPTHNAGHATYESSWWARLRVLRLLRMIRRPPPFEEPKALMAHIDQARGGAGRALRAAPSEALRAGEPPLLLETCRDPAAARALLDGAARDPARIAELRRTDPGCVGAHVAAAEACLARRDGKCALEAAEQALRARAIDLRAHLARTHARVLLEGGWTKTTWEEAQMVRERLPRFLRARWLATLGAVERGLSPCYVQAELADVVSVWPDCAWARAALESMRRVMEPALWERFDRQIWDDLSAILETVNRERLPLLLLNYPPSSLNPCREITTRTVARFASEHGIPLLELGTVLGPLTRTRDEPNYASGGHPSAIGYARIARAVLTRLRELRWVDAPRR